MLLQIASDAEVSVRFAAGDDDALEEAYRRWASLVHTLALRSTGSTADAEDITQTVFVSAWRGRPTYDPGRAVLPAWLVGIARRRIADHHRSRARQPVPVSTLTEQATSERVDELAQRLLLADALSDMSPDRRRVLELAIDQEHTHGEIAATTGLPIGTVKSHLRRGFEVLRRRLEAA